MTEARSPNPKPRRRSVWIVAVLLSVGLAFAGFRAYRAKHAATRAAISKPQPKPEEKCDAAGWCRQATGPNVAEQFIRGVWAHSAYDVWLVDFDGILGHWDGLRWGVKRLPSAGSAIWGFGAHELWIAANHAVLEGDGTTWKSHSLLPAELGSIHGTNSKDIWVTATWIGVFHYDGANWVQAALGEHRFEWFSSVWAVSKDDVWLAGGPSPSILHFDGKSWKLYDLPIQASITGLWAAASNDVWAVGDWGKLFHYDGQKWSRVTSPAKRGLNAVWGSNAHDVWAVGEEGVVLHYDGREWVLGKVDWKPLHAVTGTPDQQLWATGEHGQIVHWNGRGWKPPPLPPEQPAPKVDAATPSQKLPENACVDYPSSLTRARLLTTQQRYDEAIHVFDGVVRARPLDAAVRSERGFAYLRANDAVKALRDFGRAEALTENPQLLRQIWYNIALALAKQGATEPERVALAVAAFHGSDAAKNRLGRRSSCTALIEPREKASSRVVQGLEQLAAKRQLGCRVPVSGALSGDARWHKAVCTDCGGVDRCHADEPFLVPSGMRDKQPLCFLGAALGDDAYFYENTAYCSEPPVLSKEANIAIVTTNIRGLTAEQGFGFWTIDGLFNADSEPSPHVNAAGHWSDEGEHVDGTACVPSLKGELPLGRAPFAKSDAPLMPRSAHRRIVVYSNESKRVLLSLAAFTSDVRVRAEAGKITVSGGGCSEIIDANTPPSAAH